MTASIHDSGYKKLFSNRTIFRQLVETFIEEAWVKELDFTSCQTLDKSFVSDHYKETESDLIYQVRLHGKPVYIHIFLQFQSSVDRFMVVRVLNYITNFYLDYVATRKRVKKLPAIFPIVLYNGKRKWTAVTEISELIEPDPPLGAYALHFSYLLLNEKLYNRERLLTIRNIVSTLFLAEAHYDIGLLEAELLNLYDQEEDKAAVSLFLNWFRQLAFYGKVSPEDYAQLDYVYRTKEEAHTMLVATLEEERKKLYQAGIAEGEARGEARGEAKGQTKGKLQGQQEMLLKFIQWRFQPTAAELAQITQQLVAIKQPEVLTNVTEQFLQATTLAQLLAVLQAAVAANPEPSHSDGSCPASAQGE